MKKTSEISELKELKLALVIVIFTLVASISPYVWNNFDKTPVVASATLRPNPKPEYVLKNFFYQIDISNEDKALALMDPKAVKYSKEIWKEDFKNIYFIKVRTYTIDKEKDNTKIYFVRFDVRLKNPKIKSSWKNGENRRFVILKNVDDKWLVSDINTTK